MRIVNYTGVLCNECKKEIVIINCEFTCCECTDNEGNLKKPIKVVK